MANAIIDGLRALGMNEYEASVYSTLVGLQKATARDIHEMSRVPRGRIYDILNDLARRGFIGVEEGSPASYYVLDIDVVFDRLKKDYIRTLDETREALKNLSVKPRLSPDSFFILRSGWAIENHISALFRRVKRSMVVLCYNPEFLRKYYTIIKPLERKIDLYVVVRKREECADINLPIYEARGTVMELLNTRPVNESVMEGLRRDECAILVDGRDFFAIATAGSGRYAVIGSDMPIIGYLQKTIVERLEEV
ncbi:MULTISPECIES: helix-turn-helix domain-containing protein [unclassified Methanoculleus]|uniref:TrmB family transcriptional regulator n=1 Tax=unclassified Methanoculleus TaxID=2619537 RepID=UPI0025E0256F|nr:MULTISPECIES: helix-turn-helix domain-containing protein [unclassified Methanoculleus]MCK9317830.1 TrmB family transcriptional regulator [Methanoculleus sp.]MDD2254406.1 helix-turn-helix domain-containing protein [Methanoculleus sp.]MDD2787898.1 helix-turn-helix domain-containing protein [Methanoculleus sp.]MDD3216576.1 helix-turn-helix domain-containing protein [Methanoculleus sp.]MDD4315338.1 helix-turn-helix domain-containing protein [Methanoculleus sp.]